MFGYIDKLDKKINRTHRNYYLTQGDSFTLTAKPTNIDISLISVIKFKIGTIESNKLKEMYVQDYVLGNDDKFYLLVTSNTTTEWGVTDGCEPYIYEIEITYTGGNVETVEQSEFTILPQIVR